MKREEEAILRAQSRWDPNKRHLLGDKSQFHYSLIEATDGIMEEVIAPWKVPKSKSDAWSWARRVPDWEKATALTWKVDEKRKLRRKS